MDLETVQKNFGIALTGSIACGKSTVARLIQQYGYTVLDADELSRELTGAGGAAMQEISRSFGNDYVQADGSLDRRKMRELVFREPEQRLRLEAIIHPRLKEQTRKHLEAKGLLHAPQFWFYEASLIFEKTLQKNFYQVWAAYCPLEIQVQRVMKRDQINHEQAMLIINSQMPALEKARLADMVIDTNCTMDELAVKVKQSLESLERGKIG